MTRMTVQQAMDLGLRHHGSGNLREAEAIYRQVLASDPSHADALHLLGLIAHQAGQKEQARELVQAAIQANPGMPHYHNSLGQVLWELNRKEEAIAEFERAVAMNPQFVEAMSNLGDSRREQGRIAEAVQTLEQAIVMRDDFAEAHYNLGRAYRDAKQFDSAIAAYRRTISLKPDYFLAYLNLAEALHQQQQFPEAIAAARQAIALQPGSAEAWNNLGNSLAWQGNIDEAIAAYRRVIEIRPDWALAHYHLGMALLLLGDFKQGWAEHAWRLKTKELRNAFPQYAQPQWDGSDLGGKTIFLHTEQGFGDSIHFVRYATIALQRSGRVILQCQPELVRLFESIPGVQRVIAQNESPPDFDVHCSLLSMPHVLGTTLETIPATVPYLHAKPKASARWRQRMEVDSLNVGIVWAGRSVHQNDRNRSMSLQTLAPLGQVGGVQFHSLQVGAAAAQAFSSQEMKLKNWSGELHDFSDTAALVDNLDLVITVDTAVAHLAGALGKPVWVLVSTVADWRWMLNRNDSPWYPTMRLFRQTAAGDWDSVIRQLAESLGILAGDRTCRK